MVAALKDSNYVIFLAVSSILNCLVSQARFPVAYEASSDELSGQGSNTTGSACHAVCLQVRSAQSGQIAPVFLQLHGILWSCFGHPHPHGVNGCFDLGKQTPQQVKLDFLTPTESKGTG